MEVQLLSSAPTLHDKMKLRLISFAVALAGLLSAAADAQILEQIRKPVDQGKKAGVSDKNVSFSDAQFDTISQPMRDSPKVPLSRGDVRFQDATLKSKDTNFRMLDMSTVSTTVIPKANFTAKRAVVDKVNGESKKQADQTTRVAPITDRQIRPFAPAGEEELKKQLNDPR
jgi:hypothetical protein